MVDIHYNGILINYKKNSRDLCWELGLVFCCPQPSTQVPSLTSKKCRRVGIHVIIGTWDMCEVVIPIFHALNNWDCTDYLEPSWDLALGIPCKLALILSSTNHILPCILQHSTIQHIYWLPTFIVLIYLHTMIMMLLIWYLKAQFVI